MGYLDPFDLLVDDHLRIDVKYSGQRKGGYNWSFVVKKDLKRFECDFYICVTANEDCFIIPSEEVALRVEKIVFNYPLKKSSVYRPAPRDYISKHYTRFVNQWHLLTYGVQP